MITPERHLYTISARRNFGRSCSRSAELEPLFGLSNERFIFEGVDHRQVFASSLSRRAGETRTFSAAFRINPREAVRAERSGSLSCTIRIGARADSVPI